MSRASKRAGFGQQRGATSNKMAYNTVAPNLPKDGDRWVDKATAQEYIYDKDSTQWIPLFGSGSGGNLGGLVYHNDTNTTAVSTNVEVGTVDVTMEFDGSLIVTGTFVGTSSGAMTLTTLIKSSDGSIVPSTDEIPTMTSNSAPTGTAVASSEFGAGYEAYKAMDKNASTYWATTTIGVTPCTLEYQFATSKTIVKYTITARSDASDGAPNTWTFEAYNGSTWDTLDTQSSITFTNGEQKEYTFTNTTAYTRYRLNISANNGRSTTNIAEIEMFEEATTSSVTQHTIVDYVSGAVDHTVNFSVVIPDLTAGDYTISADMSANTGTFTLDASEQHLYVLAFYDTILGGSSIVTGILYVFGGFGAISAISDTDEYSPDTWTSKTDMTSPARFNFISSAINSKSYVFGGYLSSALQDTDEYVPDTWTSKTDMPSPARQFLSSTTLSNLGYIFTGLNVTTHLQDTDEYSPDTWTSKTDCPTPARRSASACNIDSKGYLFCGTTPALLQDTDEYSPDTWTSKTNCPSPVRKELTSNNISSNGYIYSGYSTAIIQDTDEYVPDTWTSKTDCPAPARHRLASAEIGSTKNYILGGQISTANSKDTDEYISDTWTSKTDMPTPERNGLASSSL